MAPSTFCCGDDDDDDKIAVVPDDWGAPPATVAASATCSSAASTSALCAGTHGQQPRSTSVSARSASHCTPKLDSEDEQRLRKVGSRPGPVVDSAPAPVWPTRR